MIHHLLWGITIVLNLYWLQNLIDQVKLPMFLSKGTMQLPLVAPILKNRNYWIRYQHPGGDEKTQRHQSLRAKCPNMEFFWSIFSRIQSKCGKIRTRKTLYLENFYAVNGCVRFTMDKLNGARKDWGRKGNNDDNW